MRYPENLLVYILDGSSGYTGAELKEGVVAQKVCNKSTFVVDEQDPANEVNSVELGRVLPDEVGSEALATSIARAPHRHSEYLGRCTLQH